MTAFDLRQAKKKLSKFGVCVKKVGDDSVKAKNIA
jgi:hypothetical protein